MNFLTRIFIFTALLLSCGVKDIAAQQPLAESQRAFQEGLIAYKQGNYPLAEAKLSQLTSSSMKSNLPALHAEATLLRLLCRVELGEDNLGAEIARASQEVSYHHGGSSLLRDVGDYYFEQGAYTAAKPYYQALKTERPKTAAEQQTLFRYAYCLMENGRGNNKARALRYFERIALDKKSKLQHTEAAKLAAFYGAQLIYESPREDKRKIPTLLHQRRYEEISTEYQARAEQLKLRSLDRQEAIEQTLQEIYQRGSLELSTLQYAVSIAEGECELHEVVTLDSALLAHPKNVEIETEELAFFRLRFGQNLYKLHRPDEALEALRLNLSPGNLFYAKSLYVKGLVHGSLGEYAESTACFRRVLLDETNPDATLRAWAQERKVEALAAQGNWEAVSSLLQQSPELRAQYHNEGEKGDEMAYILARADLEQKNYQSLLQHLPRLEGSSWYGEIAKELFEKASALRAKDKLQEALALLSPIKSGRGAEKVMPYVHYLRGAIAYEQGRYKKAKVDLMRAVADRNKPQLTQQTDYYLGLTHLSLGEYQDAAQHLKRYLAGGGYGPQNTSAKLALGNALIKQQEQVKSPAIQEEALALWDEVVAQAQSSKNREAELKARFMRAQFHLVYGDDSRAEGDLKAIYTAPYFEEGHAATVMLAEYYQGASRKKDARHILQQRLNMQNNPEATETHELNYRYAMLNPKQRNTKLLELMAKYPESPYAKKAYEQLKASTNLAPQDEERVARYAQVHAGDTDYLSDKQERDRNKILMEALSLQAKNNTPETASKTIAYLLQHKKTFLGTPQADEWNLAIAQAYATNKSPREALEYLGHVQKNENQAKAFTRIAQAHTELEEYEKALVASREVSRNANFPFMVRAQAFQLELTAAFKGELPEELEASLQALPQTSSFEATKKFFSGAYFMLLNRNEEALEHFTALTKLPEFKNTAFAEQTYLHMGRIYSELNQSEEAQACLAQAGNYPEVRFYKALNLKQHDTAKAREMLAELKDNPEVSESIREKAALEYAKLKL